MTIDQVAALTQLSRITITRAIKANEFEAVVYLTDSDIRIPASSYVKWIENRTVRSEGLRK